MDIDELVCPKMSINLKIGTNKNDGAETRRTKPYRRVRRSVIAPLAIRTHITKVSIVRHMTSNSDSELWKSLPWKKLRKNLFRLQCRLWKAVRVGDRKQAINLRSSNTEAPKCK